MRLLPKGKKANFPKSLEGKSTGIRPAVHHNANNVPHSFFSTTLNLHLPTPPTVRGLEVAGSRCHTDAACVSAPAPRESFQHSKHTPRQPGCRSTSHGYRDACVLGLTGGLLDQRVPGAQQTTQRPPRACRGFLSTHSPSHHSACTCSLAAAPGSRRCSGAVLWTPALTATLRFSSSLCLSRPPGRHWLGAICSWNGLPPQLRCRRRGRPRRRPDLARRANPGGPLLSQRLSEPGGPPPPCHSMQTFSSQPILSGQPSPFGR